MRLRKVVVIDDAQQKLSQVTPFYLAFSFVKARQRSEELAGALNAISLKRKSAPLCLCPFVHRR